MAGLHAPLSTLRRTPHGMLRMTRGRCGSLCLHRNGLAPSTPCRSPGALHKFPFREVSPTGKGKTTSADADGEGESQQCSSLLLQGSDVCGPLQNHIIYLFGCGADHNIG